MSKRMVFVLVMAIGIAACSVMVCVVVARTADILEPAIQSVYDDNLTQIAPREE